MSENVEIVRRSVEAYRSGNNEAAIAAYDAEVEFDVSSVRPEGGVFRGHVGVEEAIVAWVGSWADHRFEIEEVIDAGDRVLLTIHESGRGKGSGVDIDQHIFWVQTLRDGKIVHAKLFVDRDQALSAAGLQG